MRVFPSKSEESPLKEVKRSSTPHENNWVHSSGVNMHLQKTTLAMGFDPPKQAPVGYFDPLGMSKDGGSAIRWIRPSARRVGFAVKEELLDKGMPIYGLLLKGIPSLFVSLLGFPFVLVAAVPFGLPMSTLGKDLGSCVHHMAFHGLHLEYQRFKAKGRMCRMCRMRRMRRMRRMWVGTHLAGVRSREFSSGNPAQWTGAVFSKRLFLVCSAFSSPTSHLRKTLIG